MNCLATTLTCSFPVPQSVTPIRGLYERARATCLVLASLLTTRGRLLLECLDASFDLVSEVPGLGDLVIQQRKTLAGSVNSA